jgi:hypothetical protein
MLSLDIILRPVAIRREGHFKEYSSYDNEDMTCWSNSEAYGMIVCISDVKDSGHLRLSERR